MSDINESKLNIIELLMGIKEDVSSIKTDMSNFKEAQHVEKANIDKKFENICSEHKRDMSDLEQKLMGKINSMQSIQNNLVGDVDTLKHAEEKKDAKRWKTVMAFICTALSGMLLAKLPDILRTLMIILATK